MRKEWWDFPGVFVMSFYSAKLYRDILTRWHGSGFVYMLVVVWVMHGLMLFPLYRTYQLLFHTPLEHVQIRRMPAFDISQRHMKFSNDGAVQVVPDKGGKAYLAFVQLPLTFPEAIQRMQAMRVKFLFTPDYYLGSWPTSQDFYMHLPNLILNSRIVYPEGAPRMVAAIPYPTDSNISSNQNSNIQAQFEHMGIKYIAEQAVLFFLGTVLTNIVVALFLSGFFRATLPLDAPYFNGWRIYIRGNPYLRLAFVAMTPFLLMQALASTPGMMFFPYQEYAFILIPYVMLVRHALESQDEVTE